MPIRSISEFHEAHKDVIRLCDDFDARRSEIMDSGYKEATVRVEFLNPFFEALGWDVSNTQRRSIYEKDCVLEKAESVEGVIKSADYAFRIPGTDLTAFFVEAKKPSIDILNHADCYQTLVYGWNARTPLVFLTDFEQFLILNSRRRPDKHDATSHVLKEGGCYNYRNYRNEATFAEIWGLLHKENVAKGSIDRAAEALASRAGRVHVDELFAIGSKPVDAEFLANMELWRKKLAQSIKQKNLRYGGEQLTAITQKILDRLVFLRFLEDRGIEREVTFSKIGKSDSAWRDFLEISRRLDSRYNGIIYKHDIFACEDPDLIIDEDVFAAIVECLHPHNSDYLFGTISLTILGSIYERFLANIIVTTEKTACVEEKQEVRRAGGVYYTPDYIVRFIVQQTVGSHIEGKKPSEISKHKFADIACGSGTFLVEVFACLIRYHLKWYLKDGEEKWQKKGVIRSRELDGDYVLTLSEKRRILLANIYGIDLDSQAVEVSQLSLYLKLMEDESFPSTQSLFDFERHALLPDLRRNILCGNSLIESDIADLFGLPPEVEESIRPINFTANFPTVFIGKKPGFDVIVGNPPYLNIDEVWGKKDMRLGYIKKKYPNIHNDKTDILFYFLSRALNFSSKVGYIVSRAFLQAYKADKLRGEILNKTGIEIIDFQDKQVFPGVGITTCITLLDRDKQGEDMVVHKLKPGQNPELPSTQQDWARKYERIIMPFESLSSSPWEIANLSALEINRKLDAKGTQIGTFMEIGKGMETGCNKVFGAKTSAKIRALGLGKKQTRLRARNSDIQRYVVRDSGKYLIYVEDENDFDKLPKETQEYLASESRSLRSRAAFLRGDCKWWKFTWPLNKKFYAQARIICPYMATENRFALAPSNTIGLTDTSVIFDGDQKEDLKYILALLNSRVLTFRFASIGKMKGGGVLEYFWNSISKLPIRRINFKQPTEKAQHDEIVKSVEKLLEAKSQAEAATDASKEAYWLRQIETYDSRIESLVADLYELTPDEVARIQSNSAPADSDVTEPDEE